MSSPISIKRNPPCPFCKSKDTILLSTGAYDLGTANMTSRYQIICDDCKAAGPQKRTEDEAEKAWVGITLLKL